MSFCHRTTSNFKAKPKIKPVSSSHPPVLSEQWDDIAKMFEPLAPVSNPPKLTKHDASEELIVETSFADPSGTSASAVFAHNEGKQADPTHDEMPTSDSGLFAKKLVKRPPLIVSTLSQTHSLERRRILIRNLKKCSPKGLKHLLSL